eukprot:TRINITY_DN734_c0_g1_i1.p2 TRINITY_DN734_c0_g1~~TRINITY_DN734_c0_g1_i1.p2  ORF type:complete len:189 (+),score=74.69 TRINITY_DN734_c0_g1_i1:123-689(+)
MSSNPVLNGFDDTYVNPRQIPRAVFIENTEEFVSKGAIEDIMRKLQEQYSKYKLMEAKVLQSKAAYKTKIPELRKTLAAVEHLNAKKDSSEAVETSYELSDNVHATAVIEQPKCVCLWLGANVMVEYSFEEAIAMLSRNLETAERNLTNNEEDLAYLRDQITTMEVNMARCYNQDVKNRRKQAASSAQ